jgi:Fe-S-cluster containining protein
VTSDDYRTLLASLDDWFSRGRREAAGRVPCRTGCSACCHGPFDVSVADAELISAAVARLPAAERDEVIRRAGALLGRMRELEPGWGHPYDVVALGSARFDRLTDALADEPCPLLDDAGRCRIYADRPLVCRLIGLAMITPAGRVIGNECPIQDRFSGYAGLGPVAFDLEAFEDREDDALRAAAERRFADETRWTFETTIAAVLAATCSPAPTAGTAGRSPETCTGSPEPT